MSSVEPTQRRSYAIASAPGGTYDEISRRITDAIEHAVDRFQPRSGQQILDLATGTTRWGRGSSSAVRAS